MSSYRPYPELPPIPTPPALPNVDAGYRPVYASSYPPPAQISYSSYPPPAKREKNPWVSFMPPLVAGAFILLAISCIGAVAGAKAHAKQAKAPAAATVEPKSH